MKKLVALVATGVMALSLAACGGGSSSASSAASSAADAASSAASSAASEAESAVSEAASSASSAASEAAAPEGGYNITFTISSRDEFLSTLDQAAKDAAAEMGVNLDSQDAQSDQSKQFQQIETAINGGADAVIVNMVDADTGEACIEAAGGKPIVFVNRPPADPYMVKDYPNAAVCASNEDHSGGYQGQYLAEYFNEQGKTDIKYILLSGQLGNYSTTHRTDSALQALKDGGINATEATAPIVADWDRATAMDMVAPALTSTEYDCIICNNDAMALGVIEAMETAGLDPASIPIVGVDATVDGCAAVAEGKMFMTVFQNPVGQGSGAIAAAVNMIEGNPINTGTDYELDADCDQILWVPFEPVNKDNVADYQ